MDDSVRAEIAAAVRDEVEPLRAEVREILEAFSAAKGAFRSLEAIGRVARPLAMIFGLVASAAAAYGVASPLLHEAAAAARSAWAGWAQAAYTQAAKVRDLVGHIFR